MINEHNPIALRIDKIRKEWVNATSKNSNYQLLRWLVYPDDMDLVNGFLKLECSEHGRLPDIFIVLFSSFESSASHSQKLIKDWIEMYKHDQNSNSKLDWDFKKIENACQKEMQEEEADLLLVELLSSFRNNIIENDAPLVFGLLPTGVQDFGEYSYWLRKIMNLGLMNGVKIMIFDHIGKDYFKELFKEKKINSLTIEPGNLDIKGAMEKLATQGNPSDPQVQIRKLMFEMGDAISKNQKNKLLSLGEKLLKVGQKTGDKSLFASVHLIFSGFLIHFKENKRIDTLITQGIRLAKTNVKIDQNCRPVLIQLYGYKATNFSLSGKHQESIEWFCMQAELAIEFELKPIAISAYKTAIYLAHRHSIEMYSDIILKGYELGKSMSDDEVGITEYAFVVLHFLKIGEKEECDLITQRMNKIFGHNWQTDLNQIVDVNLETSSGASLETSN